MLKLEQVKLEPGQPEELLAGKAAHMLRIPTEDILNLSVLRRAVDARQPLRLVYTLAVQVRGEKAVLRRCRDKSVTVYAPEYYTPPCPAAKDPDTPPVVVGAGPAGLFAALILANAGRRPILLERGRPVEQRQKDVAAFWAGGQLNTESNVQFGEGGAGAFSDGKLNTGTKDLRHRWILEQLVSCGAPESILIDARPHVGTDKLHIALKNLRQRLLDLGADIRFGHRLEGIEAPEGELAALVVSGPEGSYRLPARQLILALGHSARDTVEMLYKNGAQIIQKPFSVGARIEHPQKLIDKAQYGAFAGHPKLGAADYKLSCHGLHQRGAYTFCMCPGGTVVAAASEKGGVIVNGMSTLARDGENANSALLVGIDPVDFPSEHPLAGMYYQREIEQNAFALGGGDYRAPAQLVGDFLADRESRALGNVQPTCPTGVTLTNLRYCLPDKVRTTMQAAITEMDKRLHGFALPDAVLTAPETRSSSSVRILRDEFCQCNLRGVYPCGEGAGYAGGIVSAAVDGIKCAHAVLADAH